MRFEAFSRKAADQRCDCLVVGVFERGELGSLAQAVDRAMRGRIRALLARGDFSGRAGETLLLTEPVAIKAARLLLVGVGGKAQYNRRAWRRALGHAITALARTSVASAALSLEPPGGREFDDFYFGRAVAEATGTSLYRINDLKSARKPRPPVLSRVLCGPVSSGALSVMPWLVALCTESGATTCTSPRLVNS